MSFDGKSFYVVEYIDAPGGLTLMDIEPYSKYVEEIFYNGVLLHDVELGRDSGKFQLHFWLDDTFGDIEIISKFKWTGWREVDI